MDHTKDHKPLVVLLCVIIFFSVTFAYRQGMRFYYIQLFDRYEDTVSQHIAANHGPLGVEDVGLVSPWMTFGYITIIFKLPKDYLQTILSIHDNRYPNITILRYAKEERIQSDVLVSQIQTALTSYFQNH